MPEFKWIGKEKIVNHHHEVPYRILDQQYVFNNSEESNNKIINGDNLEALKALIPQYEGKIKCIYIDPPYNTGNENWIYNDNVNSPKIKKWLGQVVGKESEDLTRHDKWLCMMYPRLQLLYKLLSPDGAIFISLDENETSNLRQIMDEIFGQSNFVAQLVLLCNPKGRSQDKFFSTNHEYITVYSKSQKAKDSFSVTKDESLIEKEYKFSDGDGKYRLLELRNTHREFNRSNRPNLFYPLYVNPADGTVSVTKDEPGFVEVLPLWPDGFEGCWTWGEDLSLKDKHLLVAISSKNKWKIYRKGYSTTTDGENVKKKLFTIWQDPRFFTEKGQITFGEIFPGLNKNDFPQPKSVDLIKEILKTITEKDDIILDSFAGSGTTAHAVLDLNKTDGGNRKFILIEMENYAETITAERLRRVINGYSNVPGTGGSFGFYNLGEPLFMGDNSEYINEEINLQKIQEYVWYSETKSNYSIAGKKTEEGYLGKKDNNAYYFFFDPNMDSTLDFDKLSEIKMPAEQYIIYANNCLLSKEFMLQHNIIFKKITKDIIRF